MVLSSVRVSANQWMDSKQRFKNTTCGNGFCSKTGKNVIKPKRICVAGRVKFSLCDLVFLPKITMDIEVKQNLIDMFPKSIKEISWKWKFFLLEVCSGQSSFGALKEESALLWIKGVFYKLEIIVAIFTQMLRTRSKTELRLCREKSTLEETVIS